jgi:hypothetical protein
MSNNPFLRLCHRGFENLSKYFSKKRGVSRNILIEIGMTESRSFIISQREIMKTVGES